MSHLRDLYNKSSEGPLLAGDPIRPFLRCHGRPYARLFASRGLQRQYNVYLMFVLHTKI